MPRLRRSACSLGMTNTPLDSSNGRCYCPRPGSRVPMLWYFAAYRAELPPRPFTARPSEPRGATFVFVTGLAVVGSSKSPRWVRSTVDPSAHCDSINRRTVSRYDSHMKPTVYFPLADLRPAGVSRTEPRSIARFSAGRIASRRLWVEAEGRQVGMNVHTNETAGGSGQKRTS
jgi:hypothetical protein